MFILKRQDVEISNIRHPEKDQTIPILSYQGQTFTLLNVFNASQAEEARALWRDLTDNRGKACVLLEEPDRFSVWGKVRLDKAGGAESADGGSSAGHTLGSILLLQAVFFDIEDLLGDRQAAKFRQDVATVLNKLELPGGESAAAAEKILTFNPFEEQLPVWGDLKIMSLLQELHRLGKGYFGNANFTGRALDALEDMDEGDRKEFSQWLTQGPLASLW